MHTLYDSIQRRKRPEDVADLVVTVLAEDLSPTERKLLDRAARGSLRRRVFGYTSMLEDFERPASLMPQVETARALFASAYRLTAEQACDPDAVERLIRTCGVEVHKSFGDNSFRGDRLNRAVRAEVGLELSRRKYNRKFRHLARMEKKLGRLVREIRKYEYTRVGKSGLATRLSWEEFAASPNTASFIAYYVARCNLRSEFTISGQTRPYDEIAHMLFRRCERDPATSWFAIAHVYPTEAVLDRLAPEEQGYLLGEWHELLEEIASLLEEIWSQSRFDRSKMIVRRGDDSTTWNNTASAWNQARTGWLSVLHAMDADGVLDELCPGKVMRLMAADVAAWHRSVGGRLEPDTEVWAHLPAPWEVLSGRSRCTRRDVVRACYRHGIDPVERGWVSPKVAPRVERFAATPELVHGVTVASPRLAKLVRKAGWFSGKPKAATDGEAKVPGVLASFTYAQIIEKHRKKKEKQRSEADGMTSPGHER